MVYLYVDEANAYIISQFLKKRKKESVDEKKSLSSVSLVEIGGRGPEFLNLNEFRENKPKKQSLLLHSCCGPCSTAVIESLAGEFDITVLYYNPNITDEAEYLRRKETQIEFIKAYNRNLTSPGSVMLLECDYEPEEFYKVAKGFEEEPEGGRRCGKCFRLRLEKAAQLAALSGYEAFATTLTVSPHKNYTLISSLGRELSLRYGVSFLDRDFKKKAGYQRSIELSRQYGLYRQDYCGCRFSK